jgi:redox-sensitive bicupin YhaK (pirin superfamily)
VLDGALEHFDSAGNTGVIYAGDAQWMTAGRGVIHNENPLPGTTTHALQLWVNLPASERRATRISEGQTFPGDRSRVSRFVFYPAAPGAFRLQR